MRKLSFLVCLLVVCPLFAQKPDDTPSFKVGATIFADFTANSAAPDTFSVGRAYINATGNLNHWIAFRVTPDVARESGGGSSLSGSQTFRLKYAYAQFALDDWTTKGSWVRVGMQQTPFLDNIESIYRYRFQGTLFPEREGYLTSSDSGVSARWVLPCECGDIHAGVYNGEGYAKSETSDEKALQVRGTLKLPKNVRLTLFRVEDHARSRTIGQATFESKHLNAGVDVVAANGGWSVWATPRAGNGWELLLRHDDTPKRRRDIGGVAYWLLDKGKLQTAVLVDYDRLTQQAKPGERRIGVKLLLAF